jgi:hypothetical protein
MHGLRSEPQKARLLKGPSKFLIPLLPLYLPTNSFKNTHIPLNAMLYAIYAASGLTLFATLASAQTPPYVVCSQKRHAQKLMPFVVYSFKGTLLIEPGLNNGTHHKSHRLVFIPDMATRKMLDRCFQHRRSLRHHPRLHKLYIAEVDLCWWKRQSVWQQVLRRH